MKPVEPKPSIGTQTESIAPKVTEATEVQTDVALVMRCAVSWLPMPEDVQMVFDGDEEDYEGNDRVGILTDEIAEITTGGSVNDVDCVAVEDELESVERAAAGAPQANKTSSYQRSSRTPYELHGNHDDGVGDSEDSTEDFEDMKDLVPSSDEEDFKEEIPEEDSDDDDDDSLDFSEFMLGISKNPKNLIVKNILEKSEDIVEESEDFDSTELDEFLEMMGDDKDETVNTVETVENAKPKSGGHREETPHRSGGTAESSTTIGARNRRRRSGGCD